MNVAAVGFNTKTSQFSAKRTMAGNGLDKSSQVNFGTIVKLEFGDVILNGIRYSSMEIADATCMHGSLEHNLCERFNFFEYVFTDKPEIYRQKIRQLMRELEQEPAEEKAKLLPIII